MSNLNSGKIVKRYVVEGELTLMTPAHFSSGNSDNSIDMLLVRDSLNNTGLLPGTSLAGALRSYLRERELGYFEPEHSDCIAAKLFGNEKNTDKGKQSPLIIEESIAKDNKVEYRDGVKINPITRTAENKMKYNMELLPAGTCFDLGFELLIRENDNEKELLSAFATAIQGLENGEIFLGAKKQRGLGECKTGNWKINIYDMSRPEGLFNWLENKQPLSESLHISDNDLIQDKRNWLELTATLSLDSPLLIKSGSGPEGQTAIPDTVHLHSYRGNKKIPVLPGTSLGGILRHLAYKITKTLSSDNSQFNTNDFINNLFGPDDIIEDDNKTSASKIQINESEISSDNYPSGHIVNRISIDRFTGSSYEGALFNEQPLESGSTTVRLKIKEPSDEETGLILLLLKDLWTGWQTIGGESGIGYGKFKGIKAQMVIQKGSTETITLSNIHELSSDEKNKLNKYVNKYYCYCTGESNGKDN